MSPEYMEKIDQYVMQTYARFPVGFVKGEGCTLWDDQGKTYTDFLAGIAVCNLGHCHPQVSKAVCDQALKLFHVSNLFYTQPQAQVAELLVKNSFCDRVFFCNSGAEANEGALKLARLWGKKHLNGAFTVITMEGSFHGRTLAMLSATGQDKVQAGFDPLTPKFRHVPYGDLEALDKVWDDQVCAVMLEPVLGEGGIRPAPEGYMEGLRKRCDQRKALLVLDEIQTGLGRTGKLFAYEHYGVTPDVMTLAKALANGLPAGAICASEKIAALFTPGTHATTFGAGPVIMAAAAAVMQNLTAPGFMDEVREKGEYLKNKLAHLARKHPDKAEKVRGVGLMLGLVLKGEGKPLVQKMLDKGFVINCTQENILRFVPPLVVSNNEIDAMVEALDSVLTQWPGK